jgi:hypothetical protein
MQKVVGSSPIESPGNRAFVCRVSASHSESPAAAWKEESMFRPEKIVALAALLVAVAVAALPAASATPLPGSWRKLPTPPVATPQGRVSVWTGRWLILLGRTPVTNPAKDVAASYDPAAHTWIQLSPPPGPKDVPGYKAVWTGREMLAFDPFHSVAYNPQTNTWRGLRKSINLGFVAWTGSEAIGWGGGCCGDAQSNGTAYNPTRGTYRNLPRSPLAPSQAPLGVWTGRELMLFVSGYAPDGKPYPTSFARAAAYNPATNTWRRVAPFPETGMRMGTAAWDGRELLVAAAGASSRSAYAYDPVTNRWRRLSSLPAPRVGPLAVWAGRLLFVLGGQNATATKELRDGLAYDPRTDRWSTIPAASLPSLDGASAVWTGRSLIVTGKSGSAAFTPAAR